MLKSIHIQITQQALGEFFSPRALQIIVSANVAQDRLRGQIGHDEYHFDNNALEKSRAYLDAQRALTLSALEAGDAFRAWQAFGRLTHAAQDFYAHSNYIQLWLARYGEVAPPAPPEMDPVDAELLHSPSLCSGKLYYPLEVLYFFRISRRLALFLLPRDSHAHMNLDSAEQGGLFPYAYQAAIKRTRLEFETLQSILTSSAKAIFTDTVP